jgi:hypothetical protein
MRGVAQALTYHQYASHLCALRIGKSPLVGRA